MERERAAKIKPRKAHNSPVICRSQGRAPLGSRGTAALGCPHMSTSKLSGISRLPPLLYGLARSARSTVQRGSSGIAGWLSDRQVPRPLRRPLYRTYAAVTGAELAECRLPLEEHPSLGAFFVRRLAPDARPIEEDPGLLVSPVDGTVQSLGLIERGMLLQAKGQRYGVRELLAGVGEELELEGAPYWTLYLSPRDYHRIHAPEFGQLSEVAWVHGSRHSVAPAVLERRPVLAVNERCVLRFQSPHGPLLLVLVGALNVGRIRVVGVEPGSSGPLTPARELARGEELGRFELGSTVVLIAAGRRVFPSPTLVPGTPVRLGRSIGRWLARPE